MDELPFNYLQQLQARLGDVAFRLTRLNVTTFPAAKAWSPAINAYHCESELVICVDLAGVDRSTIDLHVQSTRIRLRGRRAPIEPGETVGRSLRILALEIDHGLFERELVLPTEVNPEGVRAEYRRGILWLHLPLAHAG